MRALISSSPDVPAYRHAMAHVLNHEAEWLVQSSEPEEAKSLIRESIDLWTQLAETGNAESANDLATLFLVCPLKELRNAEASLKFANLAAEVATTENPGNPRYKAIRSIASAWNNDLDRARTLLDEIFAEQGEWVGRDYFALAILSRRTADGKAEDWFSKGDDWMQANHPGSQPLQRIRDLATREE